MSDVAFGVPATDRADTALLTGTPGVRRVGAPGARRPAPATGAGPAVLALQQRVGNRAFGRMLGRDDARHVQRKGPRPLVPRAAGHRLPGDEHDQVFQLLVDYDGLTGDTEADLRVQAALLAQIVDRAARLPYHAPEGTDPLHDPALDHLAALRRLVAMEQQTVAAQLRRLKVERLTRATANAEAPYQMMTDQGLLWNDPQWSESTGRVGKRGDAYFQDLSGRNVRDMQKESAGLGFFTPKWVSQMRATLGDALRAAVVNHYTTRSRVAMLRSNGLTLKSLAVLERDSPTFRHNTTAYDEFGLANTGFVFFFIEPAGEPLRATRFASEGGDGAAEPARISIPIAASGLLDRGWVMLSDFAQREYPTTRSRPERPEATWSELPTRVNEPKNAEKREQFTAPVRSFTPGAGVFGAEDAEEMQRIPALDSGRRQAFSAVRAQVRSDEVRGGEGSRLSYGPGDGSARPELLRQNVLVGGDIIPGLVERAVVEVARLSQVNASLGERLKAMDGRTLLRFLLKDLVRPQAMIPNAVTIREEHIQEG